uniref:Early flowering 3 n=1 Tax=Avena sativa TaxID=4498 RepID=A0A4Y5T8R3_AVESA|nr:early flowering 3 [Avena sativa]
MRRGGAPGKDGGEGDKVMGPLFPRLHVNDTTLKGGGPRAPPRNKMALYEQFSVPSSQRFKAAANATATTPHRPAVSSASAGQIGGSDRPLFPSFCVPSKEPVRTSEHINTNSNARDSSATRVESGRLSTQLKSKDTYAAGSNAECSSQRRENTTKNSSGKKTTNDDDFTVPSVFCSGVPPHSAREEVRIQEKSAPFPMYKSGPTSSRSSAKYSNTDKRYLEGMNASDTRSRDSQSIRDKAPAAKTTANLEVGERSSSFKFFSTEKTGKTDDRVSSHRDKLSSINISDKQHSRTEGHQAIRRNENAAESQNASKAGNGPYWTDIECNGASNLSEKGLRDTGEKRKRSTGHYDVQRDDSPDSSVESLPGLEISPDDVVGAIGPKHFWKARRAIVNQQRVFAVQVFELHRLIKVQKLIAASPHLLIEGDPCLGNALVTSKKKLAAANVEKELSSAKSKDDDEAQLTLQQAEYSKDNTEGNQDSPSQDDDVVEVQQNNPAASNGAVSSNPPTMPAPPDNKQNNNWCAPPPPNQWLVPVMSPSEGLVYKPYSGPCPPAGSFLAPFYASCAPLSLPSTAGDFMASPYGIPMPHHQPQHMGVGGPPPMPPMYFPPFSMPVMNPVVSSSAVEQVSSRVAPARPNAQHVEHLSRTSCNMRNEAVSAGGIWRFHPSRDSELQGSSAASSPFDRQQGEARGTVAPPLPLPASSAGNDGQPQPSCGSKENPVARVIRVVPHTARTASESAARIFRSIQMERQQNDP